MPEVHLTLDDGLVAEAETLGPLGDVVERALRQALDPAEAARRRRWAEENALLIEALAGGVEERP
jgi:hypothetical protein